MNHEHYKPDDRSPAVKQLAEWVTRYWVVLALLAGVFIFYANQQSTNAQNARDIEDLKGQIATMASSNTQILTQLAQIQADILWVKKRLQ